MKIPGNDHRRPVAGTGEVEIVQQQRFQHRSSRPTSARTTPAAPRVDAVFIVDLTGLNSRENFRLNDTEARRRISEIATLPAGAKVILRPGNYWPGPYLFDFADIERIASVVVESDDATQIRRWVTALREVIG